MIMGDSSSASSNNDNDLSTTKNKVTSGTNTTPQATEMQERDTTRQNDIPTLVTPQDNPNSITVYKLDTQKPISELEQEAKTLAIPDVVVEYIKESYRQQDADENVKGTTNLAFEPQELIVVRTPSSISLREDVNAENALALSPLGKSIVYHSMPRHQIAKADDKSGLLTVVDPSLSASSSSLGYPRSVPPSPSFGYRPLESETSAVYTIIAPVRYVGNGMDKEAEIRLLEEMRAKIEKERASARKFELCEAPPEIEHKRKRLQYFTDVCSTMFLVPGIFIAIIAPISLIPMFILPLRYMLPFMALFVLTGLVAVGALGMSGFIGNIVWHYDDQKQKLRPRLHCGTGPIMHFWGNGFHGMKEDKMPLKGTEKIV